MSTISPPRVQSELLLRLLEARQETDSLFGILSPAALYDRPIPERHRIAFYIGHLEAFDWNLLHAHLGVQSVHPEFDHLFAFGIDPVDGGLPTDVPADWPAMTEIESYRAAIRGCLDSALERVDRLDANLLNIAIEHRLMHAETLEYMFHQLPCDRKIRPFPVTVVADPTVSSKTIEIPAGVAILGLARESATFGWDNEFEEHSIGVPAFGIDQHKVTNGDFLAFVEAGGYSDPSFWSSEDWKWVTTNGISHPVFWVRFDSGWKYRTMFDEIALPLQCPVYVSHAEASAYARWRKKALPSEAEWHRAALGAMTPALSRQLWDAPPVGASPELKSIFGVEDLYGSGWEWTASPFCPFPGFQAVPEYAGYSANFFDGQHYVMKGGSVRTANCMLRPSFRNWFQSHYQYVYAGFRCVTH